MSFVLHLQPLLSLILINLVVILIVICEETYLWKVLDPELEFLLESILSSLKSRRQSPQQIPWSRPFVLCSATCCKSKIGADSHTALCTRRPRWLSTCSWLHWTRIRWPEKQTIKKTRPNVRKFCLKCVSFPDLTQCHSWNSWVLKRGEVASLGILLWSSFYRIFTLKHSQRKIS